MAPPPNLGLQGMPTHASFQQRQTWDKFKSQGRGSKKYISISHSLAPVNRSATYL